MVKKLLNYFQKVADIIEQEGDVSTIFPNTTDSGLTREGILRKFLENHLPKRCGIVHGGYIFDSKGNESKQMDLIVINDLTLQFNHLIDRGFKSFVAVEGCYAVFSVKTNLTKETLEDSLNGFISIPTTPPLSVNPLVKIPDTKTLPYKVIFAFSGLGGDTMMNHLKNYYDRVHVEKEQHVNMIIVNNDYVIINTGELGTKTTNGIPVPPYSLFLIKKRDNIGGYSLIYLITEIQKISNIGSHIILKFSDYANEAFVDMPTHSED